MKRTKRTLGGAIGVLAILASGCATYQEPPATADATPPPGYAPVFVRNVAPMPQKKTQSMAISPGRVDIGNAGKVRMYMHIVDSTGTYFQGASQGAFKNMWCRITETVGDTKRDVKKFTVREVSERDHEPIAVALVTDHSGSMGDARARSVQEAAAAFLDRKAAEDGISLVRYDHRIQVEAPLSKDGTALKGLLAKNGLEGFGGGTAIHSGVAGAIDHLNASANGYVRKAVIVFTDGQENSSKITRDSLIRYARNSHVAVCAVDFGEGINEGYMEGIARATGGSYHHIYRTSEFEPMFEDVYRRLKNAYVVEYTPQEYGLHTVKMSFCFPKDSLATEFAYDNTPDVGSITLLNVFFDFNKSTLTKESKAAIDNVVTMLKAFPTMTIEVRGHTDNMNRTSDSTYNATLSERRAQAVREAIVRAGVDGKRVSAKGFGDAVPIASNDTDEGRALNRRTEFIILTK